MIQCPHCDTSRSRSQHTSHLLTCPLHPISCAHSPFGCPWDGRRNELDSHIQSCPYEAIKHHLHQQRQHEQELRDEVRQLRDQNSVLRQQQDSMQQQIHTLSDQLRLMFPSHFTQIDHPDDPLHPESIQSETQLLKDEVDTLSANLASLELKQNVALMTETFRLQEELQSLRAVCHGMRMQLHYIMMDRRGAIHATGTSSSANVNNTPHNPTSTDAGDSSVLRGIRALLGKEQTEKNTLANLEPINKGENTASRQDTKL